MNGYWRRETVSIAEAMEMAQALWTLCDRDIGEHGRYWARGGNAKMGLANAPSVWVTVRFSPAFNRSEVIVERHGLKEAMTYSPKSTLTSAGEGLIERLAAWRHEPSGAGGMDDLNRLCVSALECYRKKLAEKTFAEKNLKE